MDLRAFPINPEYTSINDDPYNEFFIPCFSNSNEYRRYGGFFSSKNLALCAEGIQEFLKNKGTMKLVLTPTFTAEDIDAIKKGILNKEKKIEDLWITEIDSIKDKFQKDHIRALSWMINQDPPLLEIKMAIAKDTVGNLLDRDSAQKLGLADMSVGIFQDEKGNAISFRGVIKSGIINDEYVDIVVHKSWIPSQQEFVAVDYEKFSKLWDESVDYLDSDSKNRFEIIELSKAIKDKLLDIKPATISELNLQKLPKLRDYQTQARDGWIQHGSRGIFEMATGTGKTFCAISCIKEMQQMKPGLFVVIVCPTQPLIKQWGEELQKWNYSSINTLTTKSNWKKNIQRIIRDYEYGISPKNDITIIITTYAMYSKPDFLSEIDKIKKPLMLIADEVHSAGSSSTRVGLLEKYEFRLGLSATPSRYFDTEGTSFLMSYFAPRISCEQCNVHGSIIYSLTLKDAIPKFLTEYCYYPYYVDLTDDELATYRIITKKLAIEYGKKPNERRLDVLERFLFQRAKIIKNAENKLTVFSSIIDENKNLNYCIVYCAPSQNVGDDQIKRAQAILNKVPISNYIIRSKDVSLEERAAVLDKLESGLLKAVLAIQILDEGIDIPPLKNAILMSSTGNPKQFIQRRGRILRRWNGTYPDNTKKEFATIYDIFVIPFLNVDIDPEYFAIERNIVSKELERHEEMSKISKNPEYGLEKIRQIKAKYRI